jgi:hypothetical protein
VNPLPLAQQHFRYLLQHPLLHPLASLLHSGLPAGEVRVSAVVALHAVAAQEVVLADGQFGAAVVERLGVDGEAVVVDEGPAEGVAVLLILASFRQTDLALEEDVLRPILIPPYFLGFRRIRTPSRRPVSYFRLCRASRTSLAHVQVTNKNNINHHSFTINYNLHSSPSTPTMPLSPDYLRYL